MRAPLTSTMMKPGKIKRRQMTELEFWRDSTRLAVTLNHAVLLGSTINKDEDVTRAGLVALANQCTDGVLTMPSGWTERLRQLADFADRNFRPKKVWNV